MSRPKTQEKRQAMSRILDVRYTDLEQERLLCEELLEWSLSAGDAYARAFACTYLGDYHLANGNADEANRFLVQAYSLLPMLSEGGPVDFALHLYNFLGICAELRSDEQGCVRHYLEALSLSRAIGDVEAECTALNNLACAFQRHDDHETAGQYFFEAYDLQKDIPDLNLRPILLSNMVEHSVSVSNFAVARRFAEECDTSLKGRTTGALFSVYNWCCYYAALGDKQEAVRFAERALDEVGASGEDLLASFGLYQIFCSSMVSVGHEQLARRFLDLMESSCARGCVDQLWQLGQARMNTVLAFGDAAEQVQAYRDFHRQNEARKKPYNRFLARAMRTQVDLAEGVAQQEVLHEQQENLEIEASIDELTAIYNRRFFDQLIEKRVDKFVGGRLSIVMLDVDYFKEYNDFYGHLEGDAVLSAVAGILWQNRSEGVYPCRFGGDEFVCVCDGLDAAEVSAYIQAIRQDLALRALVHEKSRCGDTVTLSIGYAASGDEQGLPPYAVMQLADKALYEAKSSGRNAVVLERGEL